MLAPHNEAQNHIQNQSHIRNHHVNECSFQVREYKHLFCLEVKGRLMNCVVYIYESVL